VIVSVGSNVVDDLLLKLNCICCIWKVCNSFRRTQCL